MDMSGREMALLGAALYVCEGAKLRIDNRGYKQYAVEFTNNDPRVIKLFLSFLRYSLGAVEERIKAQLFIYPDHKELNMVRYWSKVTRIPSDRFNKVIHLMQSSGRFIPSKYGTLKVRYHHKEHFLRLQSIIEEIFGGVT